MISSSAELLGSQRPRVRSVPPSASSLGAEAVEFVASVGLILDPWQSDALTDALGETVDGRWTSFEVGVDVPRQNGKGGIIEARELTGLFLIDEPLIIHSAHEFKTSKEAFYRLRRLIESSDLDRKVKQIKQSNEEVSIETLSGSRLRYLARKGGTGRGFSGDCVILDEAFELDVETLASLLPTLSARPNPQLWYLSSAPLVGSDVLHAVMTRGHAGSSGSLCWLEYSAPPPEYPPGCTAVERHQVLEAWCDDRSNWAAANPALGIRISAEFIAREREALTTETFARERLGLPDRPAEGRSVIQSSLWESLVSEGSQIEGRYVLGVDVSPDGASASIGCVGRRDDGLIHVGMVDSRPGTGWLEAAVAAALAERPAAAVAFDGAGPAAALLPEITRAAGLTEIVKLQGREYAAACEAFLVAVNDDRIRHLGTAWLATAVGGADRRLTGDGWVWNRRAASVDISPLVAVTVALRVLEQLPEPTAEFFVY